MIPLKEDLKTVAHNLWTRGVTWKWNVMNQYKGSKYYSMIFNNYTKSKDKDYFHHHFDLRKISSILLNICRKNRLYLFIGDDLRENEVGNTHDKFLNKASRDIGKGMMTTSTTSYRVHDGKGYYMLYLTFDSGKIFEGKGVVKTSKGYTLKDLNQISTINPKLYRKE